MVELPQNAHSSALVTRAKAILLQPVIEWAKVATETDQPKQVFLRYVLPLAAIGPIAAFIGMQVFGISILGFSMKFSFMQALTTSITSFVLALFSVWVVAFIANLLSPKYGGKDDFAAAFRLVAYASTASWLAGIFQLIPALSILGLLGLYSLYLLYKGVTPVMGVPQDKAMVYTVLTIVAAIAAMIVASLVTSLLTPTLTPNPGIGMTNSGMANAGGGTMSIDLGESGSMQSNADGTMTITGPDGETVTITIDQRSAE